jgi:hypothetical protein
MSSSAQHLPPLSTSLPPLAKTAEKSKTAKKIAHSSESSEQESYSDREESEEVAEVQSKKMDNNASFFATIIDGSSFRYLIEYLRLSSIEGTFVFTKDYITYQQEDDDKIIFNDVKIKTYELTDYEFSSLNSEIAATINLSDLRNKTRTVGKKEQMDVYRRPEEPNNFYIQVRSQEKSSGDNPVFYCMPMRSENVTIYKLPEYSRGKNNPNCTIYQSDFSKVCKALAANKCSYAEFIGYEKGIIIKGFTSDGKIAMIKEYGKCRNNPPTKTSTTKSIVNVNDKNTIKPQIPAPRLNVRDADEVERFKINISIIKSLSKINGFCSSGTIKFYIEQGAPMKLYIPIGTFGKMRILIRSS